MTIQGSSRDSPSRAKTQNASSSTPPRAVIAADSASGSSPTEVRCARLPLLCRGAGVAVVRAQACGFVSLRKSVDRGLRIFQHVRSSEHGGGLRLGGVVADLRVLVGVACEFVQSTCGGGVVARGVARGGGSDLGLCVP
jgi:hypothetical protein